MYDVVFKKSPKGNMIVTKRPDMSKVEWSPAQQRQRFAKASAYAKAALADPARRAVYEARAAVENKRTYDVAFSDYCHGKDLLTE